MSYDLVIEAQPRKVQCPHCRGELFSDPGGTLHSWSPTYNYVPMFRAATETKDGIHDFDGKTVGEVLPLVEKMYERMMASPEKFRALNPSNGWGSYEEWMPFMRDSILPAFRNAPSDAIVRVS